MQQEVSYLHCQRGLSLGFHTNPITPFAPSLSAHSPSNPATSAAAHTGTRELIQACAAKGPSVDLKGHTFSIEIADTDAAREHGLMDRTEMAADHGMLFDFGQTRQVLHQTVEHLHGQVPVLGQGRRLGQADDVVPTEARQALGRQFGAEAQEIVRNVVDAVQIDKSRCLDVIWKRAQMERDAA